MSTISHSWLDMEMDEEDGELLTELPDCTQHERIFDLWLEEQYGPQEEFEDGLRIVDESEAGLSYEDED